MWPDRQIKQGSRRMLRYTMLNENHGLHVRQDGMESAVGLCGFGHGGFFGCRIEKTQLKTAERIEKLLTLLCAVAVRLLALRQSARTEPDAPCSETLSEDEWQVLWAYTRQRPLPQGTSPPTMREAILMIGRLGGHLGRKGDGMPGVKTLWQGWRDLQILVEGYHVSLR